MWLFGNSGKYFSYRPYRVIIIINSNNNNNKSISYTVDKWRSYQTYQIAGRLASGQVAQLYHGYASYIIYKVR